MQSEILPTDEKPKIPPRRVFAMLLPGFFSLALVLLILAWQEFNPPGWQGAMEDHLAAYVDAPRQLLSAGSVTVAQLPFLLSRAMPFRPVTPSAYYQTAPLQTGSAESPGRQPLPYPLLELYCIDLSQSGAGLPTTRYLVAEHRNHPHGEWIVYIPDQTAAPQVVDAAWNELGCIQAE